MSLHKLKSVSVARHEYEAFRRDGYVHLPGILTARDIERLRDAMAQAVATFGASPNSYDLTSAADEAWGGAEDIDDQGSQQYDLNAFARLVRSSDLPRLVDKRQSGAPRGKFLLDTSVWRRVPALADFALHSVLPRLAAGLLAVPAVRYYDDQLFIKQPGAVDRAAFHQDLSYFHLDGEAGCVFWIPLDPVRRGGGAMGYVPGSHRWNALYKPNIFASTQSFPGSAGPDLPQIDSNPEAYGVRYVEADPGDVVVHHFLTVHGSEGNARNVARRAFSLRYCDSTMRFRHRPGAPHQPLHRQHMRDGDALDESIHPIAYEVGDRYRRAG